MGTLEICNNWCLSQPWSLLLESNCCNNQDELNSRDFYEFSWENSSSQSYLKLHGTGTPPWWIVVAIESRWIPMDYFFSWRVEWSSRCYVDRRSESLVIIYKTIASFGELWAYPTDWCASIMKPGRGTSQLPCVPLKDKQCVTESTSWHSELTVRSMLNCMLILFYSSWSLTKELAVYSLNPLLAMWKILHLVQAAEFYERHPSELSKLYNDCVFPESCWLRKAQ